MGVALLAGGEGGAPFLPPLAASGAAAGVSADFFLPPQRWRRVEEGLVAREEKEEEGEERGVGGTKAVARLRKVTRRRRRRSSWGRFIFCRGKSRLLLACCLPLCLKRREGYEQCVRSGAEASLCGHDDMLVVATKHVVAAVMIFMGSTALCSSVLDRQR